MGMNFRSCCHKYKVVIFHFRNETDKTLAPFYRKHYKCMRENPDNLETKEDQIQEQPWMDEYKEDKTTYEQSKKQGS